MMLFESRHNASMTAAELVVGPPQVRQLLLDLDSKGTTGVT